jgi:hypothetical protein
MSAIVSAHLSDVLAGVSNSSAKLETERPA